MKILLLMILIWTISACAISEHKESNNILEQKESIIPNDWKSISESIAEFYIPPDFSEKKPRHESMSHNPAGQKNPQCCYGNGNVWLVFTIQSKPNDFMNVEYSKQRDFQAEKTVLDGKQALVTTFTGTEMVNEAEGKNYVAVLDIPQIQGDTKNLLMWAYSKNPEDREIVLKIFKSVQFPKE